MAALGVMGPDRLVRCRRWRRPKCRRHSGGRPLPCDVPGGVAEWLGSGLQSRVRRFESGLRLAGRPGPSGA